MPKHLMLLERGASCTVLKNFFFQVDFPSHAFDIEYKIPQAAKTTVQHSIETLEKPMRERLLAILAKDNTIGYVHLFVAVISLCMTVSQLGCGMLIYA